MTTRIDFGITQKLRVTWAEQMTSRFRFVPVKRCTIQINDSDVGTIEIAADRHSKVWYWLPGMMYSVWDDFHGLSMDDVQRFIHDQIYDQLPPLHRDLVKKRLFHNMMRARANG